MDKVTPTSRRLLQGTSLDAMRAGSVCVLLFFLAVVAFPASQPPIHKVIWILATDGSLSGYDAADLHLTIRSPVPLPPVVSRHPERISSISRNGLVLYADTAAKFHLWNVRAGSEVALPLIDAASKGQPAAGRGTVETSATPQILLNAEGERLFWFENRMTVLQREGEGDISRTGEFKAWTTDINGRHALPLANLPLPLCKCDTGACEETCPQFAAWAPLSGISSFFYLSLFIPGQLSEEDLATDLYQMARDTWRVSRLRSPASRLLDARDEGNTYITSIPDAGCCGWENESDDTTYLASRGNQVTLFDEATWFQNQDYDVSFYTPGARFSPDGIWIAYTIAATSKARQSIRLADAGKSNPQELRRIQAALLQMPLVELVACDHLSNPRFTLANAQLIGWPDAHHLMVWKSTQLFLVDLTTGQLTSTGLRAENAANVFLQ